MLGAVYVITVFWVGGIAGGGALRNAMYFKRRDSFISYREPLSRRGDLFFKSRNKVTQNEVLISRGWIKFVSFGNEDLRLFESKMCRYISPEVRLNRRKRIRPFKCSWRNLLEELRLHQVDGGCRVSIRHAREMISGQIISSLLF
jgi:hypothetical protein